jgi:HK97 family phage prohead protease
MPAKECDNGKWKWGETGECKYETQAQAEKDNEDYYEASTENREINKLNPKGYDNALELVKSGKVDKDGEWDFTTDDGNALLGEDGDNWSNYGKWHLGIDTQADEDTKAHYGYPYGKDGKVYREALIATRQYAGRFNLDDIFDAAGRLLDIIDEEKDSQYFDTERNKPLIKKVDNIWNKTITMEKRYFNIETRTEKRDDGSITITGHAAVFNQMSSDLGGFREIIAPNAFENVLTDDVRALVNHDPNLLLARTTSGTLNLSQTNEGLQYSFDVPDTTYGRDLIISMERGDITQSSFAFTIEEDSWESTEDGEIRTINKVKNLYDVSPVTYPAYPSADDLTLAKRSLALHKEKEENKKEEKDLVQRSLVALKIELKKRK